jgi:hypothetical protein
MNKRIEISDELKAISPLVAGIDYTNVFTVPDGYFETISNTVLICLKEEIAPVNIAGTIHGNDIPTEYFTTLSDNIIAKIKAQKELSAADELKGISSAVAGIGKTNPFELPDQYFEQLPLSILSQTDREELPAVLRDIQSAQPFEVPKGYFEYLAAAILNKAQQEKDTKVVRMQKRTIFIRYAAAAVITGALALGVFKYANKPVEIINSTATAHLEPSIEKGKNMDDKKFDETLNNLSEEDIAQYLEKNGSDADIAILTSSVDENDLPRQEDYLLDNTTLDNFLQEINTKHLEN